MCIQATPLPGILLTQHDFFLLIAIHLVKIIYLCVDGQTHKYLLLSRCEQLLLLW